MKHRDIIQVNPKKERKGGWGDMVETKRRDVRNPFEENFPRIHSHNTQ